LIDFEKDARAFDRERITVDATAGGVSLTADKYNNASALGTTRHMRARAAKIMVEGTNNIILTEDAADPGAAIGITLVPGQSHWVRGLEGMRNIRMERAGGVNGEVEVVYYR
jgi:hypothetical protein